MAAPKGNQYAKGCSTNGAPTKYSKALANKICNRLAGGESLRSICSESGYPDKSTVLMWVVDGEHDDFSDQYRRAREAAGYAHGDRVIDVVDKVASGEFDHLTAKAMLDGLKWAAERMAPKAHTTKADVNHTSSDGSMTPKPSVIQLVAPDDNGED